MILTNANIFTRENTFKLGSVYVRDGKIEKLQFDSSDINEDEQIIDCGENYLVPGFIDIHFHGCAGHDFCEATTEALDCISKYQIAHGITSICPATMTYPKEILMPVMDMAKNYKNENGAQIVGVNMEGPFISTEKIGAQNPKYVQKPNYEMLQELQATSGGLIKLVDIAPEVDGAIEFIDKTANDFVISVAHTNADYAQTKLAYEHGTKHLTHTFNAMPSIHHRAPGPILAAAEAGANAEIICDGLHVDYAAVRLAFELFCGHICLISDSCEATGLDDGQYSLGGQNIIKTGNKVVLEKDPTTIAASATNLYDCFKHAVLDAKIPLETAIAAATINPARAIAIDSLYGSIEPGKYADMLLINNNLEIVDIYKFGNKV